ncbi:MAG: DinB family protein [Flavobacteriales bacterium]|nr:DinB family protein [Flavobacteriales bacterium]
MTTYVTRTLIAELQATLAAQRARLVEWQELPIDVLTRRPAPGRWSALEVVAHMQLSSGHYHDRLHRIYTGPDARLQFRDTYRPGRLGEFSVKAMQPKDGRIGWRMRTLPLFDPSRTGDVGHGTIPRFICLLDGYNGMLERARTIGLEGPKVTSTLGPVIRFKVGDAFRFPIAHQERHFLQIERTLNALQATA